MPYSSLIMYSDDDNVIYSNTRMQTYKIGDETVFYDGDMRLIIKDGDTSTASILYDTWYHCEIGEPDEQSKVFHESCITDELDRELELLEVGSLSDLVQLDLDRAARHWIAYKFAVYDREFEPELYDFLHQDNQYDSCKLWHMQYGKPFESLEELLSCDTTYGLIIFDGNEVIYNDTGFGHDPEQIEFITDDSFAWFPRKINGQDVVLKFDENLHLMNFECTSAHIYDALYTNAFVDELGMRILAIRNVSHFSDNK